jgi:hypothetical protein
VTCSRSTRTPRSKDTGAHQGNQMGCVDGAPAGLSSLDELERHGQVGSSVAVACGERDPGVRQIAAAEALCLAIE